MYFNESRDYIKLLAGHVFPGLQQAPKDGKEGSKKVTDKDVYARPRTFPLLFSPFSFILSVVNPEKQAIPKAAKETALIKKRLFGS